jgi:hypothetical protein
MSDEVSTFRLYVVRAVFLLNFVMLGSNVWPGLITHEGPRDPMKAVAICFWASLAALSGLGIRYPLRMLPLLLLQLLYKLVWLIAVALPQWPAIRSTELFKAMTIPIPLLLIVIPWPYVLANFVKKPGDRWRLSPQARASHSAQGF